MKQLWSQIAALADRSLDERQLDLLDRYRSWLVDEAVNAGGLGPAESERVDTRHIGDSLLFGAAMPHIPKEVWDLGSGSGLPGVPLAIMYPEVGFRLVDRSGRRADLLDRATRVLELPNVDVARQDIRRLKGPVTAITSRAALNPTDTGVVARRILEPGGFALVGGSWQVPPSYPGWETMKIPADPLDQPVWILIMRRQ